jgi:hypothetical protein
LYPELNTKAKMKIQVWMEIWSTLLRIFAFQYVFFTSPYTFVSSFEFSLWASQGREPINAWFTAQLGILDSVRVYFLYVSGK